MKITLFGLAGTGTSSAGKRLAQELGLEFRSGGDFLRQAARDAQMEFLEFVRRCSEDPAYDAMVDAAMRDFANTHDSFVIEGRLAWHFIPESFKVMLTCETLVRMGRVAHRDGITLEEAQHVVPEREALDEQRYKDYYGITNFGAPELFDVVLDTTEPNLEEVVQTLVRLVKA